MITFSNFLLMGRASVDISGFSLMAKNSFFHISQYTRFPKSVIPF